VGTPLRTQPLGRLRRRWKDNIKIWILGKFGMREGVGKK
jgi:hypothetical protein